MPAVMIVEDEPGLRIMMTKVLMMAGYDVYDAEDADEAIAILDSEADKIEVLFTDISMPGEIDGVALAHCVRERWPWIGLLIASAHGQLAARHLPTGTHFISKPYQPADVLGHLHDLVESVSKRV